MRPENHTQNASAEPEALLRLKGMYANFGKDVIEHVARVYSDDVVFQDPVHRVEGLPALETYLARTVTNITSCRFEFRSIDCRGDHSAWLEWTMHYTHPRLAGGAPLKLEGVSNVRFDEKIHYHRDYLDMGGMLYEHVPVLGGVVRWLKHRMGG